MVSHCVGRVALLGLVLVLACGKKQPPAPPMTESPPPTQPPPAVRTDDDDAARRAREAEEARLREESARLRGTLEEMVFFDYDRFDVQGDARRVLEAKVAVLNQRPDVRLRIEGHADERGSVEYNLALGLRRAESVRTFLVNFGVSEARLEVSTYGEERPLRTGTSESDYAQNRRAEFRILAGLATTN